MSARPALLTRHFAGDAVWPLVADLPDNQCRRRTAMSFLELFTLFVSGITIFGVIVGVFSVYNGRMTRREIAVLIRDTQVETQRLIRETQAETRDLVARESAATRELIAREEAATRQLIQETQAANREILLRLAEILARIDERVR